MPLFRRHRRDIDPEQIDPRDVLPVTGTPKSNIKGWVDYFYIVIFFFFSGMACSGALFYFTLDDKTATQLSYGVINYCRGHPEIWKLDEAGAMVSAKATPDDSFHFYRHCFEELSLKTVAASLNSVVEIYLLSLLFFVCLIMELKEYISIKGRYAYNIMTIIYYICECAVFFWFLAQYAGKDCGTSGRYEMTEMNCMNDTTNTFIMLVAVARVFVGLGIIALIYFGKETNSTQYIPPEEVTKSCNESCSFFFLIGLSSALAVIVLASYFEDPDEPGYVMVGYDCGKGVLEKFLENCGQAGGTRYDKELCVAPADASTEADCRKCGFPDSNDSFSFFSDDQKACISDSLGNPLEDTVDSFILAYSASYLFFLFLLHGERDRFQSRLTWYLYRISFMLMLVVEAGCFGAFRSEYKSVKSQEIKMSFPRPMVDHITGLTTLVIVVRFTGLLFIFALEQYEVGFTYLGCLRSCLPCSFNGARRSQETAGDDKESEMAPTKEVVMEAGETEEEGSEKVVDVEI